MSTVDDTTATILLDDSTGVVVVDVQNDLASPQGRLLVAGGEQVIPVINALVARARAASAFVVYTQAWHPTSTPHFDTRGGPWPVHCVKDTWGAELASGLEIVGPVVKKDLDAEEGWSGFVKSDGAEGEVRPTALTSLLSQQGVHRLVVVGLARDTSVKETVLDARRQGFVTEVFADATRPLNVRPGDGARAVAAMVKAGAVIL